MAFPPLAARLVCAACGLDEWRDPREDLWQAWEAHKPVCPVLSRPVRVGLCKFGR